MPVFGGVTDKTLSYLLEKSDSRSVPKGSYFFTEYEPAKSMFVLESGQVSVYKSWKNNTILVKTLGPGDCIGEIALVDFCPRSASVRADVDCVALELPFDHINSVYDRDVDQFILIYMNVSREIARRLRHLDLDVIKYKLDSDDNEHL